MGVKRLYFVAVVFYVIALVSYISYQYTQERNELITRIDKRLIRGAEVTAQLLSPSLHTPTMSADTLTPQQDLKNRLRLSKFAAYANVEYVYSFIFQDGKVFFTSSSATDEELKTGENISYYFDEYTDAPSILIKSFETKKMQFDESADQWGHSRSVFLPHVSPSGRVYVTGADIEISDIEKQLHSLLMRSLGEALFYMLILAPFIIAYRFQNRAIRQELREQVKDRTFALQERSEAITRLLDNANQGFLTFDRSLEIESEYSQKCTEIFEQRIEGKRIGDLLYLDESVKKEFFEQTLIDIFEENEPIKIEAIFSLLQDEFILYNKVIHVTYQLIDSHRFMLILTDITDKKNLEKNVERERNVLKLIVSAIGNSDEFFELMGEYEAFIQHKGEYVDKSQTPLQNLTRLYRSIHTYKGLFAQKDFIMTPQVLHKVESKLTSLIQENSVSNEALQGFLNKMDFEGWLQKDTDIIRKALGKEFLEKQSFISIDIDVYQHLYTKIDLMLENEPDSCHDLIEILEIIRKLKYKPIAEYFSSYPKYAEQIALRLEKSIYPMEIISDTDLVVGDTFKGFAKSFVHVIRNGIDHGIETPEERAGTGKDEEGTIIIAIHENNDLIEIEFSDDGRGIDLVKLKKRAIESGLKMATECDAMNDAEAYFLVFEDYLSTKDHINELSGRGIGLSSVRSEVEKLGGSCHVISELGKGTRFLFFFPKNTFNEGK